MFLVHKIQYRRNFLKRPRVVVIPAHHLDEGGVQHDASLGVESARDRVGLEIGGHQGLVRVAQVALHVSLGAFLHLGADLLVGGLLLQLHGQVDHGHVDGRHAQSHAGQLALHIRNDLRHCLGGTRGARNDVARAGAATAPVLLGGAIHSGLRGGHGVASRHQAALDAELLLQDTHGRGQAVGSARGAGHGLHGRVVRVLVHAHDDGVGVILGRSGEDHLLGTGLQVGLHLLGCQEHAGGLADVLCTVLAERDLRRVAVCATRPPSGRQ